MTFYIRNIILSVLFLAFCFAGFGQNSKKYLKEGQDYLEERKYMLAVTKFTQAIRIDQEFKEAYVFRAKAYEELNEIEKAAEDYGKAASLERKDPSYALKAGQLYYNLTKYIKALDYLNLCTEIDKKNMDAFDIKIRVLMEMQNYSAAIFESEKALKIKKTAINYYHLGNAAMYLNDFSTAEINLTKAVQLDQKIKEVYFALAQLYFKLERTSEALTACNTAATLSPGNFDIFKLRSDIYFYRKNYINAINDLTYILINISPENEDIYLLRGDYYLENEQPYNAISDYSQGLAIDKTNLDALYKRAKAYEFIQNKEAAVRDFEDYLSRIIENEENSYNISYAKIRIYELNKEENKPTINITWPKCKKDFIIEIPFNIDKINIKGVVIDESQLIYLRINNHNFEFDSNGTYDFTYSMNLNGNTEVTLEAEDIYHNYQSVIYQITRTETDPPRIHLIKPYASDNGEIVLSNRNTSLLIEGKVTDQSVIQSIMIDNMYASFISTEQDPSFSAYINISGKSNVTIKAMDIYGNETVNTYHFNKEFVKTETENPMGITWIVFIENSDYDQLPSLEGPAKDINLLKTAITEYNVYNIIHRQNMNKAEMQRFFSIELRDMVLENNVNSILIWYAGHGKFENEIGYWLPVNASLEDEFTYFPVNSLKASIQAYSRYLKHILVVTDACESGPSFYMALRSVPEKRDCSDWTDTRYKSAQVFTSAGNEMATDQSKFTQVFVNTLVFNPDYCISIDDIVIHVNKAFENSDGQKPKFGKIAGLEDENGTFFFIRK